MQVLKSISGKAQLIAMVHVHSSNALTNTRFNSLFKVETYSLNELTLLDEIRKKMLLLSDKVVEETGIKIFKYCRNASFVLKKQEVEALEGKIKNILFVQQLINRALREVEIYHRNGINFIEIENVGAPYFIGNEIPPEELLILLVVAKSIRKKYHEIHIGIQVLSCGELEALPIAISCNAHFVRSEASVYKGLRPEGETNNRANLAKFFYLRNYLNTMNGVTSFESRRFPALWCDLQKKHTVFNEELNNLKTWLNTMLFQKMEGIVLTGSETGSDCVENDLIVARKSINQTKEKISELAGYAVEMDLPLVTGSGSNIEMYKKYADFIITGTSLKENNYWENEVDEERVKALVARFTN